MVILEFLPEDKRILEHNRRMPPNEGAAWQMFTMGWWEVPVRYQVGGVELLWGRHELTDVEAPWLGLPGAYVGIWLADCIEQAWRTGAIDFDPGAESGANAFKYRRVGDGIEIDSWLVKAAGSAPYEEHVAACQSLANRVREYLVSLAPELREHPDLGSWFRGETYLPEILLRWTDRDPNLGRQ